MRRGRWSSGRSGCEKAAGANAGGQVRLSPRIGRRRRFAFGAFFAATLADDADDDGVIFAVLDGLDALGQLELGDVDVFADVRAPTSTSMNSGQILGRRWTSTSVGCDDTRPPESDAGRRFFVDESGGAAP